MRNGLNGFLSNFLMCLKINKTIKLQVLYPWGVQDQFLKAPLCATVCETEKKLHVANIAKSLEQGQWILECKMDLASSAQHWMLE